MHKYGLAYSIYSFLNLKVIRSEAISAVENCHRAADAIPAAFQQCLVGLRLLWMMTSIYFSSSHHRQFNCRHSVQVARIVVDFHHSPIVLPILQDYLGSPKVYLYLTDPQFFARLLYHLLIRLVAQSGGHIHPGFL